MSQPEILPPGGEDAALAAVAAAGSKRRMVARAQSTRAADQRVTFRQRRPNNILRSLPGLLPGHDVRWVMHKLPNGQVDEASIESAAYDGYRLVLLTELPEDCAFIRVRQALDPLGKGDGFVKHGGLVAMVRSREEALDSAADIQAQVDRQTSGANAAQGIHENAGIRGKGLPVFDEDRGSSAAVGAAAFAQGAS